MEKAKSIEWLKDGLKQGHEIQKLKTHLMSNSVEEADIDEAIAELEPEDLAPASLTQALEEQNPNLEPTPEEPTAEEPTVEEPVAEEPTPEEPVAEEPTPEEPVAEEPTPEEPVAEEPTVEEPTPEEPTVEEPTVEEPVSGNQAAAEQLLNKIESGKQDDVKPQSAGLPKSIKIVMTLILIGLLGFYGYSFMSGNAPSVPEQTAETETIPSTEDNDSLDELLNLEEGINVEFKIDEESTEDTTQIVEEDLLETEPDTLLEEPTVDEADTLLEEPTVDETDTLLDDSIDDFSAEAKVNTEEVKTPDSSGVDTESLIEFDSSLYDLTSEN
mgnify:CR=1 FL=1